MEWSDVGVEGGGREGAGVARVEGMRGGSGTKEGIRKTTKMRMREMRKRKVMELGLRRPTKKN